MHCDFSLSSQWQNMWVIGGKEGNICLGSWCHRFQPLVSCCARWNRTSWWVNCLSHEKQEGESKGQRQAVPSQGMLLLTYWNRPRLLATAFQQCHQIINVYGLIHWLWSYAPKGQLLSQCCTLNDTVRGTKPSRKSLSGHCMCSPQQLQSYSDQNSQLLAEKEKTQHTHIIN